MQKSSYLTSEKVKIIARIRGPSQNELYTAPSNQTATRKARSPSPNTAAARKTTSVKSALDYAYSFYVSDRAGASKLFYFPNPLQKRLLDESIRSDDDIEHLQGTVLASSQVFSFDRALSVSLNNQAVYNETVKPLVYEFFQGQSSTLFIHGCADSGKSYLLRGEDAREKGLILHAIDELLKLVQLSKQSQTQETETKSFRLFCSMFFVHHDKRVDLIQRSSIPYEKQSIVEHDIEEQQHAPLEEPILSTDDFKNLYRKATSHLKVLASHYQNTALVSDSNIIVSFKLVKIVSNTVTRKREIDQESYLNFVRLADVESAQTDRAIKESFQILREYICYLGKKAEGEQYTNIMQYQKDKLIESIPTLLSEDHLVQFICTLPPTSSKASLSSMRFAAQLYADINENRLTVKNQNFYGTYPSVQSETRSATRRRQRSTTRPRNDQSGFYGGGRNTRSRSRSRSRGGSQTWEDDLENEQERNIKALERNIDELKHEILSKINVALRKDSPLREVPSNLSSKEENEEALKANRSFERLKEMLEQKEQLELETNEALKAKIQRLSSKNKKLVDEIHRLSELVRDRDEIIANYERERKLSQMELNASANKIITQQIKEEVISKSKEDLNEIIMQLRKKLHVKKIKHRENIERLTTEHKKALEALSKFEQENESLREFCERERGLNQQEEERFKNVCVELKKAKDEIEKKEQIIDSLNENSSLQEEVIIGLKSKLQDEKTQNRILIDEQSIYIQKIDALKREILKLEAENETLLRKCDTVRECAVEDNRSELSKCKEKNKKLRSELKQRDIRIRELEDELFRANIERQRAKTLDEELFEPSFAHSKKLSNEIEALQQSKAGSSKDASIDTKQQEFQKIQQLEKDVARLTEELAELGNINAALKKDSLKTEEEGRQKSQLLEKYEKQLEYLQNQQIQEIENLHIKLKDFVDQIESLRTENHQKHLLASSLVEKLAYAEKGRDEIYDKYKQAKKLSRSLKKQIKQIDGKMKRLIEQNRTEEAEEEEEDDYAYYDPEDNRISRDEAEEQEISSDEGI